MKFWSGGNEGSSNSGSWRHKSTNTPLSDSLAFIVHPLTVRFCTHVYAKVPSSLFIFALICKKHRFSFPVDVSRYFFFFISVFLDLKDDSCAGQETNIEPAEADSTRICLSFPNVKSAAVSFPPWLYEDRVCEVLKCSC